MKHLITLLMTTLIITGCSSLSNNKQPVESTEIAISWIDHVQNMRLINNWQANAKVAIAIQKKTQSAKMTWLQQGEQFDITFSGPFGHAGPTLSGNDKSATLLVPKEQPLKSSSASALLQQRLGWQLPVENAKYWMLGIPSPTSESEVTLKDERLFSLQQDGWTINYTNYTKVDDEYRPSKIIITRGDFKILLVIYKWQTQEPSKAI